MNERVSTGVAGLDEILCGGLPKGRLYLLRGETGTGKTTLGLQFLLDGRQRGERGLYVSLSVTREELLAAAGSHGWSLEGIDIYEPGTKDHVADAENTLFVTSEVELGERMTELLNEIERSRPQRVVLDSCTELRILAGNEKRFRQQMQSLKRNTAAHGCTVLLVDNPVLRRSDILLQSLVHGEIVLEKTRVAHASNRRQLHIEKLREVAFREGDHDMTIATGGVVVYPRLVSGESHREFAMDSVSSGVAEIDALMGGGLERGTATLIVGSAGSGKSTLATQYVVAAAARGERSAIFAFDESVRIMKMRARGVGQDADRHLASGLVQFIPIDPAETSLGEFSHAIRAAEADGARLFVIDSLNGYLQLMDSQPVLARQLHDLLGYLRERGVVVLLVLAQVGVVSELSSPVDVTYLADNVILMRYFEAGGRVRKAISVVKKRVGPHEDTIREFSIGAAGFTVSEPLARFHGLLGGVPALVERDAD